MELHGQQGKRMSATTRSVAKVNAGLILETLRERGALSRREIAQATGLSRATVNRLTDALLADSVVVADRTAPSTGGRPPRILRYNGQRRSVLAIDLGPRKITGAVVDMDGAFVHREIRATVPSGADPQPKQVFNRLLEFCLDLVKIAGEHCPAQAVAVSVPGRTQNGLVEFAPALQWWGMPLGELLHERLELPVLVENDVNLLALVEHRRGAGVGCQNMVAVSIGTGVGAGLVLDGRLHRGWQGGAGELGYLLVEPASLEQAWPGFGDLESRIGRAGIGSRAAAIGVGDGTASIGDLLAAAANDELAQALVSAFTDELALAIANISVVASPEVVVIGGQVGRAADGILGGIRARLTGRIPAVPRVLRAQVADAELVGAAELAMDHALTANSLNLSS